MKYLNLGVIAFYVVVVVQICRVVDGMKLSTIDFVLLAAIASVVGTVAAYMLVDFKAERPRLP